MNQQTPIFDRNLYRKRREGLQVNSEAFSKLASEVAIRLIDRLSILKKDFKSCWQIGFDGGAFLRATTSVPCLQGMEVFVVSSSTTILSFSGLSRESLDPRNKSEDDKISAKLNFIVSDEEALPIGPHTLDMIISPLGFQWVNDLKGVLLQCLFGLKPDGLMMAAFVGEDSLWELQSVFRQIELDVHGGVSNRFAPLISSKDAASLLQSSGFALPVVDRDRIILSYPNAATLLNDIKDSGHGNMLLDRQSPPLTKGFLKRVEDLYQKDFFLPDGGIQVTLDLIFMSGWSPSSKQQQPLKPGSATYSLKDVLDT